MQSTAGGATFLLLIGGGPIVKNLLFALALVLGGCATQVYHPSRDQAAMQKDIAACTEASVLSSALNVAVREDIIACLKDMGYRKGTAPAASRSVASKPAASKPAKPASADGPAPCVVPCKGASSRR